MEAINRKAQYQEAVKHVQSSGAAGVSIIQRQFGISYNSALHLIDQMVLDGIVKWTGKRYEVIQKHAFD